MDTRPKFTALLILLVGIAVGLLLSPTPAGQLAQERLTSVSRDAWGEAVTSAARWNARIDARTSLFIEYPELLAAIQKGGAFGGDFSVPIATQIFNPSEAGIADARRLGRIEQVTDRTWIIYLPLVNVIVFETDEGIVLVDSGTAAEGPAILDLLRSVSSQPIHTIIYTHGHVDHAYGSWALVDDQPEVIAQADLVARFERYQSLPGNLGKYMGQNPEHIIASGDFFVPPTRTFRDELTISVGGEDFVLRARPGETDDQLYVWVPSRSAIATADYYQGFVPNLGNGKRVQRYPEEWAEALREMAAETPRLLLPAHGVAITESDVIKNNLNLLADALDYVIRYTKDALNAGVRQDLIPAGLSMPERFSSHPTLQEQYVSWRDISKMVIRRYTGWWDDIPSHWSPATFDRQAEEIIALAGGIDAVAARARTLATTDLVMATHLTDWAWFAQPNNASVQQLVIDVYRLRILDESANTQEILAYVEIMAQARQRQLESG